MTPANPQIRTRLNDLGLNDREARLYLALLENGDSTASQLAVATRIPQNKIYQSLEALLESGLIQRQRHGRHRIFSALDPAIGLARPLKDMEIKLDAARSLTSDLATVFAERREPGDTLGDVEILREREAIRERYMQLLSSVENEVAGFARGPYAFRSREDLEAQFSLGSELRERCYTRWVYEIDPERDPLLLEFLRDFGDAGDIRVTSNLPLKMVLFDGRTIIFTDDNPDDPDNMGMAIMHHPAVVKAFSTLFEFFWASSPSITDWFDRKD